MKELGIKTPVTAIESFEFTEQPELFEGMWYIQAADPTSDFVKNYNAKYSTNPTLGAPNAYDELNLIVYAFENAEKGDKKPNIENVIKKLNSIKDYSGALGNLNMGDEGIIISKAVVREVRGGKFVNISGSDLD
jgi:ABC-type branched-subunit amino acid transport system substrate-binding protein